MKKIYHQFNRILIANRGEIAVRIIKTAKEMGLETVAIYTTEEKDALHVEKADLKALMNGTRLEETYLNAHQIIALAQRYQVDAIHPGYGFLSENEVFAELCNQHNIVFIGPEARHIKMMGNKEAANKIAARCEIPLLQKINGSVAQILKGAKTLSLPIVIKASAGGGGKGMRVVHHLNELEREIKRAASEALRYFGNASVYIEEYIQNPRHIEVQILGDHHGNTVHLFERECSIQRRHQKVIEESPAPNLDNTTKQKIIEDALKLAQHIGYTNAGTVEFLLTTDQKHFFLEMNTRIQVEHPVTELITGIDIVKEQIQIAAGMPLSYQQNEIEYHGHAIEARIYAEDPSDSFAPSFGKIMGTHIPSHPHIRIDGGAQSQENLNPNFDPLLKKVIAYGQDRNQAILRLQKFLNNFALFGVESNREFILKALKDPDFQQGNYSTSFFEAKQDYLLSKTPVLSAELEIIAAAFITLKHHTKIPSDNIWNTLGYWRLYQQHQIYFEGHKLTIDLININTETITIQIDQEKPIEISCIRIEQNELSFIINEKHFWVNYLVANDGLYHIQHNGRKRIISDIPERIKRNNDTDNVEAIKTMKAPMPEE